VLKIQGREEVILRTTSLGKGRMDTRHKLRAQLHFVRRKKVDIRKFVGFEAEN
jgi:hypothetical protein